jgi:hypothetical protein
MLFKNSYLCTPILTTHYVLLKTMVGIAQQVRASDCDSEGRGFEPHYLPQLKASPEGGLFILK